MFVATDYIKNGDGETSINVFKCDITGEKMTCSSGYLGNEKVQISERGLFVLFEQYIKMHHWHGDLPFFIEELSERFLTRNKRKYLSKEKREEILFKYKNACVLCGSNKNLEIDHIIPFSKGGGNESSNLQVLCKKCNLNKSNKIL